MTSAPASVPSPPSPTPARKGRPRRAAAPPARRAAAALAVLAFAWAPRVWAAPLPATPVLSFAGIERLDGSVTAEAASPRRFREVLDELQRAGGSRAWPAARARDFARPGRPGEIRLGLIDVAYGLERRGGGVDVVKAAGAGAARRAFVFAPLEARTYRGGDLVFRLDPRDVIRDRADAAQGLEFDADDGLGYRPLVPGEAVRVRYRATGTVTLRLRANGADGPRYASATLVVGALATPSPDDTLFATGQPFAGGNATGSGYVYLAPGHTEPVNPVVVVEGFDLDNSLGWDELYALLDQQNLIEDLRGEGFDLVVLDFTDATDYVERNAFVLVDLLDQVRATLPPGATIALVGASMGGLVGRYALAWMEAQALPHDVRTFISFDGPQQGADIPLGIQYWFDFFADQSADAMALRDVLNSPAAREMLVYHYTTPAGSTGEPDPLRTAFDADLAGLGYPSQCRNVAVANGSGLGLSQGFGPATQIVQWDYDISIVTIHGNVWSVPDGSLAQIFQGRLYAIFTYNLTQNVSVSGTLPYDGAPGGSRNSMAQMDSTAAPYGDIVALYDSHCFIPTVSALDFDTPDLFHDVLDDPNALASTPFDAIYVPDSNQAHTTITPQNAVWFKDEIGAGVVAVEPGGSGIAPALAAAPNPFAGTLRIRYTLSLAGAVRLAVYGVDGRRIATLEDGMRTAGPHAAVWSGLDGAGRPAPPGMYFVRLDASGISRTVRTLRLR